MSADLQPSFHGTVLPQGFPLPPKDWVYEWKSSPAADPKLKLYSYVCSKGEAYGIKGSPRGHRAVLVVHGFGEHSGRYLHFPHFLNEVVETVASFDHRGHGRSEGARGHIGRFDDFVEDVRVQFEQLHSQMMAKHGKAEIHLFGHSLGGHIALRSLLKNPELSFASASISAPFLGLKTPVPAAKRGAASLLSGVGLGWLQLPADLDVSLVSRDGAVVEAYRRDRLIHGKMTPRMFSEIMKAIGDTMKRDSGIKVPLQIMIPLQDGIVDSEKSLEFFRNLKVREKSLKTYPGFYHEAFNDIGKEQFFADLVAWMNTHHE